MYIYDQGEDKLNAPRVEAQGHPHSLLEVFFIAELTCNSAVAAQFFSSETALPNKLKLGRKRLAK